MTEVLYSRTFAPGELPDAEFDVDINLPVDISPPWEVVCVPLDAGGNPAVQISIDRLVAGVADELTTKVAMTDGIVNSYPQTEPATRVRVSLDPGATPPDGGLRLQILGTRDY